VATTGAEATTVAGVVGVGFAAAGTGVATGRVGDGAGGTAGTDVARGVDEAGGVAHPTATSALAAASAAGATRNDRRDKERPRLRGMLPPAGTMGDPIPNQPTQHKWSFIIAAGPGIFKPVHDK
jgi:hypothetical protein